MTVESRVTKPLGTITFLFSDIEDSTGRLAALGADAYKGLLEQHHGLLRAAFLQHSGFEFGRAGDSLFVAFGATQEAINAAIAAQCALATHRWPDDRPVRVRMGLHTCDATASGDDYIGIGVHCAARICDAAHGGQVLISATTRALVAESAPFATRDLGEYVLKGLPESQRLYQLLDARLPSDFPPLRTARKRPANLAEPATPLLGREGELRTIASLLRDPQVRVLTLTGPGGTGKTRLAEQAAIDLVDDFAHGVFFVPLAPITEPALVVSAIAQALGVSAAAGQSLPAYLAEKRMLLVLDNFEQVLEAAPEVAALLAAAPLVRVLATSREALRLSGERILPINPLPLPELRRLPEISSLAECASVALFVERAKAVQPAFALTAQNAVAVAEICVRLDGLPLAIELAAARTKLLSPEAMLKRLPGRLQILAGGARDLPVRQQTIRNTIAWSYDLLNERERELFAGLAVFTGGFTLDAAEAVLEASLEDVASLADKSLLRQHGDRLHMLDTIRVFALEKFAALPSAGAVRDRHAAHIEAMVGQVYRDRAADERASLELLEREHDNIRAALDWLRARVPTRFARLACELGWFWHARSHFSEGRSYLDQALALAPARDATRARLLSCAGELAAWMGDLPPARRSIDEAVSIWRDLGQDSEIAAALIELGWGCFIGGEDPEARRCMEQALHIAQTIGEAALVSRARIGLLQVLVSIGEHLESVEATAREALAEAEGQGDLRSAHFAHHFMADCALIRGDGAVALPRYRRALELAAALGDRSETASEIQGVAMASAAISLPERALELGAAAAAEFKALGVDWTAIRFWCALLDRYLGQARAALGPEAANAASEAGRRMALESAIGKALSSGSDQPAA